MDVTVVVSGVPKYVSLSKLARNFDTIFDTNEIGTFRLRDIPNDFDKRIIGLDFENGFDAMNVQQMLNGFKYRLDNGSEYTLKCKISTDPDHLPNNTLHGAVILRHSKNEEYSNSLVPLSKYGKQHLELHQHLHLLKTKIQIVEAQQKLVQAKRKLKREYHKVDTDSENEKCHQCIKPSNHRERRSGLRDKHSFESHKTIKKMSSTSNREACNSKRSPYESRRSPFESRRSQWIDKDTYETRKSYYDSTSKLRRSSRRTTSRSPISRSRREDYRTYSTLRRLPSKPRDISSCFVSSKYKNYNEHIYFNRKSKRDNTITVSKEGHSSSKECVRIDCAVQTVIFDIVNLVQNEIHLLAKNDRDIVTNEFKNYVNSTFNKIKTKFDDNMSVDEIIKFYRRGCSKDEDKDFLLKLIRELKPMATNPSKEKNGDSSQRSRLTDMWDDLEEMLNEIPMDALQDNDSVCESNTNNESDRTNIKIEKEKDEI